MRIGFSHNEAWEIARQSTVEKTRRLADFSLPYGFVQSPALASLALDRSGLGKTMVNLARSNQTRLTCYVDDVVLSGLDEEIVARGRETLVQAAAKSGFRINLEKSQEPDPEVRAFNIVLSYGSMVIANDRLTEFERIIGETDDPMVVTGIIAYVRSVNPIQVPQLVQVGLGSLNADVRDAAEAFVS